MYKIKSNFTFEKYLLIPLINSGSILIVEIPFSIILVFWVFPIRNFNIVAFSSLSNFVFCFFLLSTGLITYTACPCFTNSRNKSVYILCSFIESKSSKVRNNTFIDFTHSYSYFIFLAGLPTYVPLSIQSFTTTAPAPIIILVPISFP